ncbi:MAG TPA: methylmalonyl Co-A mutase-associated GTPase MeaB [Candidatus Acidoferrales bacterium]|nr:methylmalonyl Co-A mutase-associated GTPase MeaB [Candidatus Acidoferrales bacterium]
MRTRRLAAEQYVSGVLAGDRTTLARTITVIESDLPSDNELSAKILDALLPLTGKSRRIGITGVPGVGKSTFLDKMGLHILRERGEKLAVLSIDPSSPVTGGSILGDKTRMEKLATEANAFIRPSPSRGALGGVAGRTRETMLICEAAGFNNIWIETVGVGQSEIAVRSMTDFVLLLLLPGAGDELQGIKRGILELVDAIAINKADGSQLERAQMAKSDYESALHLFAPGAGGWSPPVLLCSAQTGSGIPEVWECILKHGKFQLEKGLRDKHRREQSLAAMRQMINSALEISFLRDPEIAAKLPKIEEQVRAGKITPFAAARALLCEFHAARTTRRN